jgi:ADP-ribose pyrophosphatase YjhB (NUDIX family)
MVRRGSEPMKGLWTLPGGMVELGEPLQTAVTREVREETGLTVDPLELIELLDRIHCEDGRIRFHYVVADYLCLVVSGELQAASDADAVRWVERAEWSRPDPSSGVLQIDPVTARVVEAGWLRARELAGRRNR